MNFWKSVRTISKRRWIILGITVLCVLAVWLVQRGREPVYEAWATVMPSEAALQQSVLVGGTGASRSGASRQTQLANLMRLAESRAVQEQVSQALGDTGGLSPRETIRASVVEGDGREGGPSELVEIRARAENGGRAILLANTAAQVFSNYYQDLRLRDIQSRRLFLEGQMESAARSLRRAEADLKAFEQEHRIALLAPSREGRGSQGESEAGSIRSELSAVRGQIREVTRRLAQTPRTLPEKGAPADPSLIKDLQDERDTIQASLDSEIAKNPEGERVSQLRRQLTELERRLVVGESQARSVPNPDYDRVMKELAGLKQERSDLLKQLGSAEQDVLAQGYIKPGADVQLASLLRAREAAVDRYSNIQVQLSQVRQEEEQTGASRALRVLDDATRANGPLGPDPKLWLLYGSLTSFLLAVGLAHVLEAVDNRIRTDTDVEGLLQLPVTGVIPRYSGRHPEQLPRICYDDPLSPLSEAFRFLRTDLLLSAADGNLKAVMVATAKPGQGGSITAANLAISLAQDGKRVVLIDADLRRPSLHRVFKLPNEIGLAEVLKDERDLPNALANTEIDNLALIPAGNPPLNPSELLGSWRMRTVIGSLKEVVDFVVLDTPSAVAFADTIVLSQMVDGVLLVVRAQQVARGAELQVRNLMNKAKARILGVVLNDVPPDDVDSYHYHSQYYPARKDKKHLPGSPEIPPQLGDGG